MRTTYREQLTTLRIQLAEACGLTASAMARATEALLQADVDFAESVISGQDQIAHMSACAEEQAVSLVALQQPVAGELRTIVGAMHVAADVNRMGALAAHVAKLARRRQPNHVLPDTVSPVFERMGAVAVDLAVIAQQVLQSPDPDKAARIREQDGAMDDLHRQLFGAVMDPAWSH
ncbi:phosphate signaling complex PhoU family protein, partial [Micromonospora sp. WMMD736]|uniref:phosphate signaling complex PhoU family protein n=1 Tax=Micromonospora sp. WMMD736 TaxID=3404112 RepID=UPI003B93C875